jgi:single-strand DNA-binding protein
MKYVGENPVTEIRFAVNGAGNRQDESGWFRVVFWGKLAEIVNQYATKGSRIYVQGRLQAQTWEKDGEKRSAVVIVGQEMVLLDNRSEGEEDRQPAPTRQSGGSQRTAQRQPQRSAPSPAPTRRPPARNSPQPVDDEEDLPF